MTEGLDGKATAKGLVLAALLAGNAVLLTIPTTVAPAAFDEYGRCAHWGGGEPPQCVCFESEFPECDPGATVSEQIEECSEIWGDTLCAGPPN